MPATQRRGSDSGTREAILAILKDRGEVHVFRLAEVLGVTQSAVRQHLGTLVRERLVTYRVQKGRPGHPRHVYRLTESAEPLFPKRYEAFTLDLLGVLEAQPGNGLRLAFEARRDRRIAEALRRLGAKPFGGRVRELCRILDEDGYLASVERLRDGAYLIAEHNCAILSVARRYGQACTTELEFIRAALPDAVVDRVAHQLSGAHVCAYRIERAP